MPSLHEMLSEANKETQTTDELLTTRSPTRWDVILEEFCSFLNEHYREFLRSSLNEAWSNGAAPRVRTVRLWPRGQRNKQWTVLAVQTTDKTARVLGVDAVDIAEEEEFKKWLVAFSLLPRFLDTLQTLKDLASQPVEGVLRANAELRAKGLMSDIIVRVPPEQQHRLADASEAKPVERVDRLYVEPITPPIWGGSYSASTKPIWLVAGGYALRIDSGSDAEQNGHIQMSGLPVSPSVLDENE